MPADLNAEQKYKRLIGTHPLFVFDLDSTVTRQEILPLLARELGMEEEMAAQTERAMSGIYPFGESFLCRASLLLPLRLSRARQAAAKVPLNVQIVQFLRENASRCLIMTGNLDVWISALIDSIGMQGRCLCSRGTEADDHLAEISYVLDKGEAAKKLPHPYVAVGDGSNDAELLCQADFAIGFSGVRSVSSDVQRVSDMIIDNESELCSILNQLV